jgi:hypothetical protein
MGRRRGQQKYRVCVCVLVLIHFYHCKGCIQPSYHNLPTSSYYIYVYICVRACARKRACGFRYVYFSKYCISNITTPGKSKTAVLLNFPHFMKTNVHYRIHNSTKLFITWAIEFVSPNLILFFATNISILYSFLNIRLAKILQQSGGLDTQILQTFGSYVPSSSDNFVRLHNMVPYVH